MRSVADTFWRDPIVWLLVGAAFLLRIAYNLALHPADEGAHSSFIIDEREYFGAAHMLAEGRGFSFFDTALWVRPPLYVVLLASVMRVFGTATLPMLMVQSALSAATLLPLGLLAHWVAGRVGARWTVGLGALYLPFTLFAGLLLSETLFLLLFAWTFVALLHARHSTRRVALWWAAAGLLLGLATLTRATTLVFVPLAAVWLALGRPKDLPQAEPAATPTGQGPHRATTTPIVYGPSSMVPRLWSIALMIILCALVLLPWTVRNYRAYGRFVPVDTTGGYNLWFASVGVRDEPRLKADLLAIPNPADRQSYAYARAFERIAADPLGFVGKGLKESLDLWRPSFSAEERQVGGYSLGRVPGWHLASLLIFDDLLYVGILMLAVLGLILAPPHPLKGLTGLWVLVWVVLAFIFFAVTRFRLPVVASLLPWAGVGLAFVFGSGALAQLRHMTLHKRLAGIGAIALVAAIIVPAIPLSDTLLGIERWSQQAPYRQAEALLREGKAQEAVGLYTRANTDLSDTRYALAAAYLQTGQTDLALAQLRPDEPEGRFEPDIIRGGAARMAGNLEAARSFFNARPVQVAGDAALRWAWDHLDPPVVDSIEVGSGLDVGYIRGFHAPEVDESGLQFRWTGERPEIRRLQVGAPLLGEWSGWRPSVLPNAQVNYRWVDGTGGKMTELMSFSLVNHAGWRLEPVTPSDAHVTDWQAPQLRASINAFVASGDDPRLVGVRLARIFAPGATGR